jgi:hypothetical protein
MPNASHSLWFTVPSLVLATLIYLLLARFVLSLLLPADHALARTIATLTNPVVRPVGFITPRVIPPVLVVLCTAAWLLAARLLLHQAASVVGMRRLLG